MKRGTILGERIWLWPSGYLCNIPSLTRIFRDPYLSIAGILILVMPRLLNYIVAVYLIVIGVIGIFGAGNYHF